MKASHVCIYVDVFQSADSRSLVVPGTKTMLDTHNFVMADAVVWNGLPANFCFADLH